MTVFPLDAPARKVDSCHMKPSALLRSALCACWIIAPAAADAQSKLPSLQKAVEGQASPATEKPDDARKRLEQWLQDARDTLARLENAGTTVALPAGVNTSELEDRRRDLEQIILTTNRSIKNFAAIQDAGKELQASRDEDAAWSGFSEKPPYSFLMIDELLNERDALLANLASSESSLTNYTGLIASVMAETKSAEENVSSLIGTVQKAPPEELDAAKWRLDAARSKSRMLAARAGLLEDNCEIIRDRIDSTKTELALLDRKIRIARANSRFNDEDLAKLEKICGERKQALHRDMDVASKRLKPAMAARNQAQETLDNLVASAPAEKPPPGLDLAKYRLDVSEGRVDTVQSLKEGYESLIQLEDLSFNAYQDRRTIIAATSLQDRAKALDALVSILYRMKAWESVVGNELARESADLSKLESRAASVGSDDPRFSLLNEQRSNKSEKLSMLQRCLQAVTAQRKMLDRWVSEYSPKEENKSFQRSVSRIGESAWNTVKKIWSFEVLTFEDKVEVEGKTITGKIPVTLGMLLRALLFFFIGYRISSMLATRIQNTVVGRGHIAEAQARTLRTWLMIVVGVFLAIGTLSFLKIPLTVFAFFGGALAIGLGFGMQTLIKNFISGIIVLFERKVRVGDILDVDGIVGTVAEINTRSSVVRGFDGVETMIPNSVFLENRVTNWTLSSAKVRRILRVGVAYGTPPHKVMDILKESAARHGLILKDPEPFAVFEDFGDNALMFCLYFWLELDGNTNANVVASDLRLMIEKQFTDAGIGIPFPQRDMHLATDKPIEVRISSSEKQVV